MSDEKNKNDIASNNANLQQDQTSAQNNQNANNVTHVKTSSVENKTIVDFSSLDTDGHGLTIYNSKT
jgi:hypothetical protein